MQHREVERLDVDRKQVGAASSEMLVQTLLIGTSGTSATRRSSTLDLAFLIRRSAFSLLKVFIWGIDMQ